MSRYVPSVSLLRHLRGSRFHQVCQKCQLIRCTTNSTPRFNSTSATTSNVVPLRKQLKEEAKAKKQNKSKQKQHSASHTNWELTVGIEIHAELNTSSKLFSNAQTSIADTPNTHVARFDAATPGAQPEFQVECLLPALRAAIALGCEIQPQSSWDRKHYFWWDQPNGYQITQYYEPFAQNGTLTLHAHDDIDPADGPSVTVGIKQVQMEQDTAKTILQPPTTHLLDFNRVSHPLIEIISLPQIHSPKTAAAFVRKIQSILKAIDANTTGMELGGLRADINVSVRKRDGTGGLLEYGGVKGLGQRTEIKNLSSFKAVEDAITAERDRQIAVLESGGTIEGETRGWTIGSTETKRIRGKEGEVDYRYMPDPDLGKLLIGDDLVAHLRSSMPLLPDQSLEMLVNDPDQGLSSKDAKTLIALDDGDRLDYYMTTLDLVRESFKPIDEAWKKASKAVANWVLMDVPSHLASVSAPFPYGPSATHGAVIAPLLADIVAHHLRGDITLVSARRLLTIIHDTPPDAARHLQSVNGLIDREGLRLVQMTDDEYKVLAQKVVESNQDMAGKARADLKAGKGKGKAMWFVGQMVRGGEEGRVQPERAEQFVHECLLNSS